MNTQTYTVNIRTGVVNITRVDVSQGDTGRTLAFKLYDGLIPFTPPTGSTVTIVGRKPSKLGFSEACTVSGNVATVATTLAMTQEAGKFPVELRIEANGESIGTANFTMYIEPSPHPDGTTDGTHATVDNLQTQIGNLANLATTAKTNLVSAINEAAQSGGVVIDDTLTQTGQAADAKKTGDEISAIKADLEDLDERVEVLESGGGGSGLDQTAANLLCNILSEAVYGTNQSSNINTLLELLTGGDVEVRYSITNNLTHAQNSNASTSILSEQSYSATITASSGYTINTVTVTMGGTDVTSTVYSSGTITIPSVTGNIVITATAELTETVLYNLPNTPVTFDGSNYIDTQVALDGDYTLSSSRPFTIIAETTKGTTGGDQYLFAENATPTTKPFFYFCLNGSTKIYTYWFGTKSTTNISMASGNNVKIAFVKHEGESPTMYVKVNDNTPTVIQFPSTPSGAVVNSDDYLYIGCSPSQASSTRWKGTVSKFEVYARAFSTNEINTFLGVS